jgi:hypothetical protein
MSMKQFKRSSQNKTKSNIPLDVLDSGEASLDVRDSGEAPLDVRDSGEAPLSKKINIINIYNIYIIPLKIFQKHIKSMTNFE